MRNSFAFATLGAALFALTLLFTAPAHANIFDSCGDIDVEASGSCTVSVDAQCDLDCQPVNVRAACAARLEGTCSGSCPKVPSVECTGSCQADCEASCKVTPAQFDCAVSCKADGMAHCNAQCASNADSAHCQASCKATFDAECDGSCKVTPGSADCTGKCQGSCQGSCTAQTELQCQVDCQGHAYANCEAEVSGGCKADCTDPQGALFCNGQYIDHAGTVNQCIQDLKAALPTITIDVSAQAEGSSSCSGNSCEASGSAEASAHCAFSPSNPGHDAAGAFGLLAVLGAVGIRRRRTR